MHLNMYREEVTTIKNSSPSPIAPVPEAGVYDSTNNRHRWEYHSGQDNTKIEIHIKLPWGLSRVFSPRLSLRGGVVGQLPR